MTKHKWKHFSFPSQQRIIKSIRSKIGQYIAPKDIPLVLQAVFTGDFNHGVHIAGDYESKTAIVQNISLKLQNLKKKEHQSGTFQAYYLQLQEKMLQFRP